MERLDTGNPVKTFTLDQLAKDVSARVVDCMANSEPHSHEVVLRLMELGFLPGESVRVIAVGFPGADPLAVRVGQATFALRRHEAALVHIYIEELA